jgi:hypothetical protein
MRWFIGLHPRYQREDDSLIKDFLESEADILYTHIDCLQGLRAGDPKLKEKTLVVFLENPTNDEQIWGAMPSVLEGVRDRWGDVFATGPTDNRTKEIVHSVLSPRNYVPLWPVLPYTYRLYQRGAVPQYGDYLLAWAYSPLKGRVEIDAARIFLNIKVHVYSSGGPTLWSMEMFLQSRGLIWASRLDSVSRAFTSAALSLKPAILLKTNAQFFNVYTDLDDSAFRNSVLLGEDTWSWLLAARKVIESLDYAVEWGLRLWQFFEKHGELWKWGVVWERFRDQTGLRLPKDATPLHHLPPIFFNSPDYFDNEEYFPQGPWSNEPPSVNWETGRGL